MLDGELRGAVGTSQIVAQSNGKVTGSQLMTGGWIELVQTGSGNEISRMVTVLHESAHDQGGIKILRTVHEDRTKRDGFSEFGMKFENRLARFLFGPVLTEGNRMSDEGWVRVMENGKNRGVAVGEGLHSRRIDRVGWEHSRILEGTKNIILPGKRVARLVRWEIVIEGKTDTTTMTVEEKFIWDNIDTVGIAVAGEKFIPRTKSMVRNIVAVGNGLVKVLRVVDGGEDSAIAYDNFLTSNVGLVEILGRSKTIGSGLEGDKVTDGDNDVWVLVIIVTLFDIRWKKMMEEFVRARHGSWLNKASRRRK